jgi:hypothetical protein
MRATLVRGSITLRQLPGHVILQKLASEPLCGRAL